MTSTVSTNIHVVNLVPRLRKIAAGITALAALPFALLGLLLFLYAFFVFRPQLPALHQLLHQAAPAERRPPPRLRRLLHLALSDRMATSAARTALYRLYPRQRIGHWRQLLWTRLLAQHFSAEDLDALYCALAYNGAGHGLEKLAWRLYGRSLRDLDDTQTATLVLVLRAPKLYTAQPGRLAQQRDNLLRRAASLP